VLKLGVIGYGSDLQNVVADGKHQRRNACVESARRGSEKKSSG